MKKKKNLQNAKFIRDFIWFNLLVVRTIEEAKKDQTAISIAHVIIDDIISENNKSFIFCRLDSVI